MGRTQGKVNQQHCRVFGSRAHSRAGRYCSNGSTSVHLTHVLPLALVRTKTRLARRRGFHVNKYRQSQSGWSLPCLHGRRRHTNSSRIGTILTLVGRTSEEEQDKHLSQHCCTGTKRKVDILPDGASHVRDQGLRQTGEEEWSKRHYQRVRSCITSLLPP